MRLSAKEIKCLRGHLDAAYAILAKAEGEPGESPSGKTPKFETKAQMEARFDQLIMTGTRAKKPDYLKRK